MKKQDYEKNSGEVEQDSYRTGQTAPPKSRSGLIALLLAVIVLLGGMVSALGLWNFRLLHAFPGTPNNDEYILGFSQADVDDQTNTLLPTEASLPPSDNVTLELHPAPAAIENIPQESGLSLQEIYEKNIDTVVSVTCTGQNGTSTGTGVVISANGYIVTNAHVVTDATEIEILLTNQRRYSATPVGMDVISNLAVLRIDAQDLPAAQFGDSSTLRVGDTVVSIGDPLGAELRGTMTDGIISAINRDIITDGRATTLIQTTAILNSGNAGGPLLNCYGQVIGINTTNVGSYSSSDVEGIGFAIPSTTVKQIVDQLIGQGYVSGRPTIGITGQEISEFDRSYYHIPQGIYITEVAPGSDASIKGIEPGDILLQFDNARIVDSEGLQNALYSHAAGDTVTLVLYRSGSQYSVDIILGQAK